MKYALGNMLNGAGGLNADQLSLDLQFAADKTLTARKGPTPVLTRGSTGTYFGPNSINVQYTYTGDPYNVNLSQDTIVNGKWQWTNGDTQVYFGGSNWLLTNDSNLVATSASTTSWRPDGANWSGTGATVTTQSTFGIVRAANNEPRFDHDPVTLASSGLLIEESRTNSITGSNAFNTWTTGNCTVSASSVVTPEGTADAWKIVEDSLTATHSTTRPFTPVSGTTYTASVWIKSAENGFAFLGLSGGGFPATFISVNLSTGSVSTALGTPIGATSVGHSNGWWRVSFSLASTASSSSNIDIRLSRDGNWANRSYLGNGVNGMYCYGAQVEAGSFATSYIPTTTSALARSADVCSITGANFTNLWNASEGTMIVNSFTPASGDRTIVSADDNTANEMIRLRTEGTNPFFKVTDEGSELVAIDSGTVVANTAFKLAGAYKLNDFASSINGGVAVTDTTGTVPTVDRMRIGAGQGGNTMCGCVSSMRYYKKRLSDFKIQALTAP